MSQSLSDSLDRTAVAVRPNKVHVAIGAFVLAVSVMLVIGALLLPRDMGYSIIGAQAFPLAVALLLAVVGAGLVWQGMTGGFRFLPSGADAQASPNRQQWQGAGWVSAGLLANALLISQIGFVLSSTVLFMAAARAFGSRSVLRDLLLGLLIIVPVYLGFTKGLGVPLPALIKGWI
ncbi:tripartite tricarboxylate transporter TctB family protein [Noviherbaspirillum aerium]|uniref:tripartite tricarboxylate transporter TctB family protein n=1 Tax=Noviherbaspirillum aerium TaxID=2588497 RepID=UPI00124E861A|nr:tripartite tricarboxylate transporter TctB family protein [Noviherbaspirillum aerium]